MQTGGEQSVINTELYVTLFANAVSLFLSSVSPNPLVHIIRRTAISEQREHSSNYSTVQHSTAERSGAEEQAAETLIDTVPSCTAVPYRTVHTCQVEGAKSC